MGLDLTFYENFISGREGPYEGCSAPMVDVSNYECNLIIDKKVKPEESFINSYIDECLKSKIAISATRRMHRIIDAKYKNFNLNKVMTEQCQHLNTKECKRFLILLSKLKDLLGETLGIA